MEIVHILILKGADINNLTPSILEKYTIYLINKEIIKNINYNPNILEEISQY
jgi:hypothetical protein